MVSIPEGYCFGLPRKSRRGLFPNPHVVPEHEELHCPSGKAICGAHPASGWYEPAQREFSESDICPHCAIKLAKMERPKPIRIVAVEGAWESTNAPDRYKHLIEQVAGRVCDLYEPYLLDLATAIESGEHSSIGLALDRANAALGRDR